MSSDATAGSPRRTWLVIGLAVELWPLLSEAVARSSVREPGMLALARPKRLPFLAQLSASGGKPHLLGISKWGYR
jgi:hypothetical protein